MSIAMYDRLVQVVYEQPVGGHQTTSWYIADCPTLGEVRRAEIDEATVFRLVNVPVNQMRWLHVEFLCEESSPHSTIIYHGNCLEEKMWSTIKATFGGFGQLILLELSI